MSRSLIKDLNDPKLFINNKRGEYEYIENEKIGKSAYGNLKLSESIKRSSKAQLEAGGDSRRTRGHKWGSDDGGHLIGARFGGSPYSENLTAQNMNLNRQDYKNLENKWAEFLDQGEGYNVFVNIESFGEDRPNDYMGYAIYEYPDGTRSYETFSYSNESRKEHEQWDKDQNEFEENEQDLEPDFQEEGDLTEGSNYSGEYADDYGEESETEESLFQDKTEQNFQNDDFEEQDEKGVEEGYSETEESSEDLLAPESEEQGTEEENESAEDLLQESSYDEGIKTDSDNYNNEEKSEDEEESDEYQYSY